MIGMGLAVCDWLKAFRRKIADWYQGEYVPPPENDPHSSVFILSIGHYEKPPLAKAISILIAFWLEHWKWIIGVAVAIAAIVFRGSA